MSYPYYALVTDADGKLSLREEPSYCDTEGTIIGNPFPAMEAAGQKFVTWAIDCQDLAIGILRHHGYRGLGGRLKKTGVMLCQWSGMPHGGDYLRISLNGVICNPDEYPEQAALVSEVLESLVLAHPKVMKALDY
jgi:hypothetical protein